MIHSHTTILPDLLDRAAASRPSAHALVTDAESLTNEDLRARVLAVATGFQRLGVRPMDRVALLLPDGRELVVSLFACFRLGAVAVPLDPGSLPAELTRLFRDCQPRLAIVHEAFRARVRPLRRAFPELPAWVTAGGADAPAPPSSRTTLAGLEATVPQIERLPVPTADCLALLLYTSGTTARPKGVMHLQGRMARAAAWRARMVALVPDDVCAALSPLSHAMGLMGALLPAVSAGATLLLPARDDPAHVAAMLEADRATVSLAFPGVYAALSRLGGPAYNLRALRRCYSGGDLLSPDVARAFRERFGVEIREGCGMTELPGYAAVPGDAPNRPGSIGLPAPGVTLRLVDDHEQDVPAGEVGEIWVKSDVATVGYWNNPAATAALLHDGWLRTGDLARADADGYLYYAGRKAGPLRPPLPPRGCRSSR
jgi:acyl-CoA synthetase (AMP-forming)/AMP-acid ligase II